MRIRLLKVSDGLIPFDEEAERVISKFSKDSFVECEVKQPRNQKHHKKFFQLLADTVFMLDDNLNTDDLLEYIKEKLGMYRVVAVGEVVMKRYGSIAFHKMSQPEFDIFYEKAVNVLALLVETNRPDNQKLIDKVLEYA